MLARGRVLRYHLTICARTAAGLGACSEVGTFRTLSESPATPTAVGVDAGSVSWCGLTMHWLQPALGGGGVVVGWEVPGWGRARKPPVRHEFPTGIYIIPACMHTCLPPACVACTHTHGAE
jgi:hypothetical protein